MPFFGVRKTHLLLFAGQPGRNMSVNQRVFSIVVRCCKFMILEFLTGRKRNWPPRWIIAAKLTIADSYAPWYSFEQWYPFSSFPLDRMEEFRLLEAYTILHQSLLPFQFFVLLVTASLTSSIKAFIRETVMLPKRMHLGQHILVCFDTYSFSRFGSRTHNIDFSVTKGHVFQLLPHSRLGPLAPNQLKMRCWCRSQPMLTEKYFCLLHYIRFISLSTVLPTFLHKARQAGEALWQK